MDEEDKKNVLLHVSSIIAAGVVSQPGKEITDAPTIAKSIVDIARAIIDEVNLD